MMICHMQNSHSKFQRHVIMQLPCVLTRDAVILPANSRELPQQLVIVDSGVENTQLHQKVWRRKFQVAVPTFTMY